MNDTAPFEIVYTRRKVSGRAPINGKPRTAYPEYNIWTGMIGRCHNPKHQNYRRYGARGILVCDRWREDFANFFADMGPRASLRHSIDRIDNDKGYSLENCRWATPVEQARNKSQGGRSDGWTADDLATLAKMWSEYHSVDAIAAVLNRSPGTVRLRAYTTELRRDTSYLRLSRKHPDIAGVLRERGPDAFLTALQSKIAAEKAEKERRQRVKQAAKSEIVAGIMARQDDRYSKMRALRLAGCDMAEIGRQFGITRERVRQIQLLDFRAPSERKVSTTRPVNRARHVDRLIRGWNTASVEARLAFLELANSDPKADLPRLLPVRRRLVRNAA